MPVFQNPYFGFIQGHTHLSEAELQELNVLVGNEEEDIVSEFERQFSGLVGTGKTVSFAAGRMGFYALMRIQNIQSGDEVVLQGATCSVMANAVLRTGATPVYADIDPETYGSLAESIEKVLSNRTKLIVAQHSFGIPCNIQPIVELARSRDIFVLEDCALTLGSSLDGVVCGNFGNAALFSTDHSKPLNTLTGGLIYTRDSVLFERLNKVQTQSGSLSYKKQYALWKQLLFERKYCRPDRYGRMQLFSALRSKIGLEYRPFLDEDFGLEFSANYPYPAQLPSFLAALGIFELKQWQATAQTRKKLLKQFLDIVGGQFGEDLPSAYWDNQRDIIPLRLAWSPADGKIIRERLSRVLNTSWTWFMQPIVATSVPLVNFGYNSGNCPFSESIGEKMINLPCNVSIDWQEPFSIIVNRVFAELRSNNTKFDNKIKDRN